ncbi:MAG: uracil-DNA glycosylase [Chloroflexi bacterium]|nr:uracil-DNA glycosylase [Chloroflexota bacterium]
MELEKRTELMRAVRDEVFNLTESPLYEYRVSNGYHAVLGQGRHDADIMFIGEAPGKNEAQQGIPFCGSSGRVLDELLESIGLDRDTVYITNIVKDRPPDNRDPTKAEIELYAPFLERQIDIIQPRVIATLGRFSMEFILKKYDSPQQNSKISRVHGQLLEAHAPYGEIYVLPLFHPAVALYRPDQKQTLFEDFEVLKQFIA